MPTTRSPALNSVTPSPTALTSPARSQPSTKGGSGGVTRPAPTRAPRSVGLTFAARTRTTTCPGSGAGSGRSATRSTSGPPSSVTSTTFIPARSARAVRVREEHGATGDVALAEASENLVHLVERVRLRLQGDLAGGVKLHDLPEVGPAADQVGDHGLLLTDECG